MKYDLLSKQFQIYSDTIFKRKYICILLFNLHVLRYTRLITIYMKNMLEIDIKQQLDILNQADVLSNSQ